MELTFAAEPESLAYMRRALGRWLRAAGANQAETYEILVACGELCANAVVHAYSIGEASYVVTARGHAGVIELEVRDSGRWRESRVGSERQGLRLASKLVDKLEIDRKSTGTVVRLRRELRAPDRPGDRR
jgi:anti-sigma regulatory factor (Ser/Thr protein kinase)